MIVVLSGGTGGAKFVDGVRELVPAEDLTIVVNTGDDHDWWGLHVSPDVDSIIYVLAGMLSPERGWGVRGDTFHCLEAMKKLAEPAWFSVGDRDLATHLLRTKLLSQGYGLSQATAVIARKLGVRAEVFPMSDDRVETRVDTDAGDLSFEEYFVQRFYRDKAKSVRFVGVSEAKPAPGVLDRIASARAVLIAPSNPVTSIGPILEVPGIRPALVESKARVVAVSPIVGQAAVSGPAADLMRAQGFEVSIRGVAQAYQDFMDVLVADDCDRELGRTLSSPELEVHCTDIWMRSAADRTRIARTALALASPEMVTPARNEVA